jgi:hypothetical protein
LQSLDQFVQYEDSASQADLIAADGDARPRGA